LIKVFKFGGFAVSDAQSVKNLANIIASHANDQILIIVSAMGETTDALENLCKEYVKGDEDAHEILKNIKKFHENIMLDLFENKNNPVFNEIANTFVEIEWMLEDEPHPDYDFNYDQIVSIGEFLSSRIVAAYLNQNEIRFMEPEDLKNYITKEDWLKAEVFSWETLRCRWTQNIQTYS
jgi:aspartate kinase